jgi:putative redox protein
MADHDANRVTVEWAEGLAFRIQARGTEVISDQAVTDGGKDLGPSPVELFIGSLGSCIGFYIARYCERHGISREGLRVELEWDDAENPHRIGAIRATIAIPAEIPENKRAPLIRVAEGCTVHHTLTHPPPVSVVLHAAAETVRPTVRTGQRRNREG